MCIYNNFFHFILLKFFQFFCMPLISAINLKKNRENKETKKIIIELLLKHPKIDINKYTKNNEKFAFGAAVDSDEPNLELVKLLLQQEKLDANLDTKYIFLEFAMIPMKQNKNNNHKLAKMCMEQH